MRYVILALAVAAFALALIGAPSMRHLPHSGARRGAAYYYGGGNPRL